MAPGAERGTSSTSARCTTSGRWRRSRPAANQRIAAGQSELDLGLEVAVGEQLGSSPLPIVSLRMGHLWDALCTVYDTLGFDEAAGGEVVSRQLVLARIIEPTSKQASPRVLAETGIPAASYATPQTPPTDLRH